MKSNLLFSAFAITLFLLSSCSKVKNIVGKEERSSVTGWAYNDPENGGFEYKQGYIQKTGPGLVFIEGGTFVLGRTQDDVMFEWNNMPRRVTIPSFYIDKTEVRNVDYREYLHWTKRVFVDYPEVYKKALPDTMVWRSELAYNEPYVNNYLRHKAYSEYPVVGVSWEQASDFCEWRTDRVNERILIEKGILKENPDQRNENNFNTQAYLNGQYEGVVGTNLTDLNPDNEERRVRWSDGILLPKYRLPSEAEWEYAALATVGNSTDERIGDKRMYPWNGHWVRNDDKKHRGKMMANFSRGKGDFMGSAGALNDAGDVTVPVVSYWPNDFGLFCMAGNVNEWVADVYRPLSSYDVAEFNPYRGNVFKTPLLDEEGNVAEKDSLGRIRYRSQKDEELVNRVNYRTADNRNYRDGDLASSVVADTEWTNDELRTKGSSLMYLNAQGADGNNYNTLINDEARVYKGGSWKDRVIWLSPGARRFLDQKSSRDDIGFRCAMTHVGSPIEGK